MLFNSIEFLIFFPFVIIGYYMLPPGAIWAWLLLASYTFYMWWEPAYIILILFSTLVDYTAGINLEKRENPSQRRWILAVSIVTNLGLLFTFKYFNFFQQSLVGISDIMGWEYRPSALKVLLPVGISFYTFQTLSYTIDVYRRKIPAERHLGRFALYVAFFPQLVAGPIERASRLLPQFLSKHAFDYHRVVDGLKLVLWGMFKKVVIADRLSLFVDMAFQQPEAYSGPFLCLAIIFFSFQIYCDFSGYSDIAIGSAQILGYDLMDNFDRPYYARSIPEFWRRWHISLSTWFQDYVYIPMGGSKGSRLQWFLSIAVVFIVSGLWHGAAWTFVVWGGLHGFYMLGSRFSTGLRARIVKYMSLDRVPLLHTFIQMAVTFALVNIAWFFFRAQNIHDAWYMISHLGTGWGDLADMSIRSIARGFGQPRRELYIALGAITFMELVHMTQPHASIRHMFSNKPFYLRWVVYLAMALAIINLGVYEDAPFIYFQF